LTREISGADVTLNSPLRPGGAQLHIEPAPGIDDLDAPIDALNALKRFVGELWQEQNFHAFLR